MTLACPPRLSTPVDLARMPDNSTLELVDGKIVDKFSSLLSSEVEGMIAARIRVYTSANPVAEVFPGSLGYQCFSSGKDRILKPDVTVVLTDRMRHFIDDDPDFMPIVPDLAVEVVSFQDTCFAIADRVIEYQHAGFPLIWVADPMTRTITVYPQGGRSAIFTADDILTAESVLPGFRCKVADFFPVSTKLQSL